MHDMLKITKKLNENNKTKIRILILFLKIEQK